MKIFKNFFSFEGIDFSGKTTQIHLLLENLKMYNFHPLVVREPGGTKISEKIRDILLSPANQEIFKKTELLLYEAARSQLVHQMILPALKENKFVIVDRFYDSTTTYQGFGRNLDVDVIKILNNFATSNLKPYKTFFIDISPEESERRRILNKHKQDRLEKGGIEFFNKIRQGFLKLCIEEPKRFVKINGERKPEEIADEIWNIVKTHWSIRK